jgi:hypothetical protein
VSRLWNTPLYQLTTKSGKGIIVDVTLSVNPALGPNKAITEVVDFFVRKKVKKVIDFGAGALRHTLPLLKAGIQVCAVDFEEQYVNCDSKRVCCAKRQDAERDPNFSALVYPRDFMDDERTFDAALLCYTLQGMPLVKERQRVLALLYKKLADRSYLVWMSRFGDAKGLPEVQCVEDGHYKFPVGERHSFYREYTNEVIHRMMLEIGWRKRFHHIRSLGQGGRDQLFVYAKRKEDKWI